MTYNGLYESLLLMARLSNGEYVPLPSVQASYGPFDSLAEAKTDLANTFKDISNVPRGYTFCVIENNKPQEYWFTSAGDWASVQKKNTASSSSVTIEGILFKEEEDYIKYSTDGGITWYNLVPLADITGPQGGRGDDGKDGKDATVDLSKIKIRVDRAVTTNADDELVYSYTIRYTVDGVNWYDAQGFQIITGGSGTPGGEGFGIIGIATWRIQDGGDGNKYWTIDYGDGPEWLEDDEHNKVRANGIDGQDGQDYSGTGTYSTFKSIVFKWHTPTQANPKPDTPGDDEGSYSYPIPNGWSDGVPANKPAGTPALFMTIRWFFTDDALMANSHWTEPEIATDNGDVDFEYSNAPLDTPLNVLGYPKVSGYIYPANPNGWYDAGEVADTVLLEANWMAIRKIVNGVPQNWSRFKIRGESGTDGISPAATFKTHVFRRSSSVMASSDPQYDASRAKEIRLPSSEWPTGGSYASPIPTNTDGGGNPLWHDGIPEGSERVWESVATVVSNSDTPPVWSEPALVADNEKWDFEWCDLETLPAGFSYPSRTSPDDDNPGTQPGDPWYDEPGPNANPVWKAERPKKSNYEYVEGSSWFVYRIKGEKGQDGTSLTIKGKLFGVYGPDNLYLQEAKDYYGAHASELGDAIFAIFGNTDNWTKIYRFSKSGSTVTATDITSTMEIGDMYIYDGDAYIWDGDNFYNGGRIQGPEGPSGTTYYTWIKYSNDPRVLTNPAIAQLSGNGGEDPGDYIGLANLKTSATESLNPADYTWKKWKGEDGWGYEYIFILTSKDAVDLQGNPTAPDVPTLAQCTDVGGKTYQDDDYVPTHLGWSDDPESPYKDYPYCWVAYRQKINDIWTEYKGTGSSNGRKACLFAMYSSKGRGISNVTEMYALSDSKEADGYPAIGSEAWSATYPAYDDSRPTFIWLWNYEIISYDDGSNPVLTPPACIGGMVSGKGILRIEEYYYASSSADQSFKDLPDYDYYRANNRFKPTNPNPLWTRTFQRIDKDYPYLWNYEVVTFEKVGVTLDPTTQDQSNSKYYVTKPVIIAEYAYTDIEYLKNIFKKVEGDSDTAYLGGLLGVVEKEGDNDVLRAMLNATNLGQDGEVADGKKGKLIIASGFHGREDINNATFKVYENGRVEMKDAFIQGFLEQYFKNYNNVRQADYLHPSDLMDPSKATNRLAIGWTGLEVDTYKWIDLSGVNTLPSGKMIITNSWYITDDGVAYYNSNNSPSYIQLRAILPNGVMMYNTTITLCNGWVEVSKLDFLGADNQVVSVQSPIFNNIYIVHAWGGNVVFSNNSANWIPTVNENQVVTGSSQSNDYNPYRGVNADSTDVIRIYQANTGLISISGGSGTKYVVLPDPRIMNTDVDVTIPTQDLFEPKSYLFKIWSSTANFVFKTCKVIDQFDDADAADLQDLAVTGASSMEVQGTLEEKWFKLTYIPSNSNLFKRWILEAITPVTTV